MVEPLSRLRGSGIGVGRRRSMRGLKGTRNDHG
jgi:hypothetical protein